MSGTTPRWKACSPHSKPRESGTQDVSDAGDRLGGGAIDPLTGKALPWNPVMPQQKGGYQMLVTELGVWFATDGIRFGGKYQRGIRFARLN